MIKGLLGRNCWRNNELFYSTAPKAINPRIKVRRAKGEEEVLDEDGNPVDDPKDKIDPFGENPGWDPSWVKAYKINYIGKVCTLFSISEE